MPDTPQIRGLQALVGKTGTATSVMLPSGACEIEGRTLGAMSEGMAIEAGTPIRVIKVRGNTVIVRPLAPGEQTAPTSLAKETAEPEDELARPIDSLGLEPLDEASG